MKIPRLLLSVVLALPLLPVAAASATTTMPVIVQGTTDVRDAGLLNDVIKPGFEAAYPQYTLTYVAVGTGQALTNARAGQGDAVLTHAPTQEAQFITDGFSADGYGRAVFFSDYVIVGPASDPAGVLGGAAHDAAAAFALIATAGAAGRAEFVSRGDNSGTNSEEKTIWQLTTGVTLNTNHEPGDAGTTTNASWYHKSALGQGPNVVFADQCNGFTSTACYTITDRGTFNHELATVPPAVTNLKVVADKNASTAPGGTNLLVNPFHAYAVNPAKFGAGVINSAGATAFVDYLSSSAFQARLATYPNAQSPAFFADAAPSVTLDAATPTTVRAGATVLATGTVAERVPGGPLVVGATVNLVRAVAVGPAQTVATATTDANGHFSLPLPTNRSSTYSIQVPSWHDLSLTTLSLPRLSVTATVALGKLSVNHAARRVTFRGSFAPRSGQHAATIEILGQHGGRGVYRVLKTIHVGTSGAFSSNVRLAYGKWRVYARYSDPGVVTQGHSSTRSLSV